MALEFDGVDDYVNIGSGAVFDNMASMTFSMWTNSRSAGEVSLGRYMGKTGGGAGWRLGNTTTNRIFFVLDCSITNMTFITAASAITYNAWNHVLLTTNFSLTASDSHLYINGTEVTYGAPVNGVGSRDDDSGNDLNIGGGAGGETFDGYIEEVSIYSSVVNASDIALLSKSRVRYMPLQTSVQPISYWPMDEFAGGATASGANTILDRCHTNHGTPSNSPLGFASQALSYNSGGRFFIEGMPDATAIRNLPLLGVF